ncbi:hypothetical protein niasHT_001314 [Heterodera trifolii]|uniref:G-protein coupled receptors family 1 profile domain-containing protein n=1 Tax=Heterodera trifolii TaxID=157864 RepID=A0ABD2LRJ8_9BILA
MASPIIRFVVQKKQYWPLSSLTSTIDRLTIAAATFVWVVPFTIILRSLCAPFPSTNCYTWDVSGGQLWLIFAACAIVLKASPIPVIILIGKFIVCFLNGTKNDKAAKAEWPTESNFEKKG